MWISRYFFLFFIAQVVFGSQALASNETPLVVSNTSNITVAKTTQPERLVGNIVFTDQLTKSKQTIPLTINETNADKTIYSTGDVVAKDGRVLQVRVGDAVFRLLSGSLWTLPLKSGTAGQARVELIGGFAHQTSGLITWKTKVTQNSRLTVEADITYRPIHPIGYSIGMAGTWLAHYSSGSELPDLSLTDVRGSANTVGEVHNFYSIEFQRISNETLQVDREIGTVLFTDKLTKISQAFPLIAKNISPDSTTYSSGDEVSKDGRVLQIRVGDAVFRPVSGSLWTLPLKTGTSGKARVVLVEATHQTTGTIDWNAKINQFGESIIEATVAYRPINISSNRVDMFGTWTANYASNLELPNSSLAQIRGFGHHGGILNMLSVEFKPR